MLPRRSLSSGQWNRRGGRALYFLLAGAAARFRYLQPGLAITLAAVGVKMLTADFYHVPTWASPVFIAAVLAVVISIRSPHRTHLRSNPAGFH